MRVKCDECGCFMKTNIVKSDNEMIKAGWPKEFVGSFICKKCGHETLASHADIEY